MSPIGHMEFYEQEGLPEGSWGMYGVWVVDDPDADDCRTYWGSHGCHRERGHAGSHECTCCDCVNHPDPDSGCVAKAPYYGIGTVFYGEDVRWWTTAWQKPMRFLTTPLSYRWRIARMKWRHR